MSPEKPISLEELEKFEAYLQGPVRLTAIMGVQEPLDLTPQRLVADVRRLADIRADRDRIEEQYFALRVEADNLRKMLADANGREEQQLATIALANEQIHRLENQLTLVELADVDGLVKWAREQARSHHNLAVERRHDDDMLNIHNALSSAYLSLATEIPAHVAAQEKPVPMCAEPAPAECQHVPCADPKCWCGGAVCGKCEKTIKQHPAEPAKPPVSRPGQAVCEKCGACWCCCTEKGT